MPKRQIFGGRKVKWLVCFTGSLSDRLSVFFSFVMIYASGFAGGEVLAGIRLGVLLEIAAIGMRPGFYAVQPIPGKLILYGSIGGLIELVIVGATVGAIYKPAFAGPS